MAATALALFGPLAVAANLLAQQLPFNAIFLVSDPMQKWRLAANFMLYMLPFLAGAFFLGTVFLKAQKIFGRVYFADLTGAGLCGLAFLLAMYIIVPDNLIIVPLVLWLVGSAFWLIATGRPGHVIALAVLAVVTIAARRLPSWLNVSKLAVSDYKGVAYARKFPDSQRVYESASPFGYLEVYSSSYLHFAPGLSDNAAFNLPKMPTNAYLGMYIDGDGPIGSIRDLPPEETAYYRFLPMIYPYLIRISPTHSWNAVLRRRHLHFRCAALGSNTVTVAEGNPAVLNAFPALDKACATSPAISSTIEDPRHRATMAGSIAYARVATTSSTSASRIPAGLLNPGGFAICGEVLPIRARRCSATCARSRTAASLSVTLWNKEEPPKSVLKLYATAGGRQHASDPERVADSFFGVEPSLDRDRAVQARRLYEAEIEKLRAHTRAMSFDEIYYKGFVYDDTQTARVLDDYHKQIFATEESETSEPPEGTTPGEAPPEQAPTAVPATTMGQLAWHRLINGGWDEVADAYVFDSRLLTNNRPYFAGYGNLRTCIASPTAWSCCGRWGYLLIWATLAIACA